MKVFPKIILVGDSITQLSFSPQLYGFGSKLTDTYQRRADVLNRGFSGYNTDWILQYISTSEGKEHVFPGGESTILITIFFGANDSSDPILNPRHHVPVERFEKNLKKIYSIAKESCPKAKMILIGAPPVDHEARLEYQIQRYKEKATGKLERTIELSGKYANAAQRVAEELNLPFIHLWKEMQDDSPNNWQKYLNDGLHLSEYGNKFVGEKIIAIIEKEYPELSVNPCPFTGQYANSSSKSIALSAFAPFHDQIDHTNPEEAFCSEL